MPTRRLSARHTGAVRRFLAHVAGPAGTLLVLDDLQWADTDALELLTTLLHAPDPVRVVAAYRDTEAPPRSPIATLADDLAASGLARHCPLSVLSPWRLAKVHTLRGNWDRAGECASRAYEAA